jgi:hypothetical protein
MASITSWTRIEPKTRAVDLRSGLEARFHDPLWALARQRQIGEFEGEDAASPVTVRLRADASRLTRLATSEALAGGGAGEPFDGDREPLEAAVEREAIHLHDRPDLHHRYEVGLQFLRLLDANGAPAYRTAYIQRYAAPPSTVGEEMDNQSRRFIELMGRRVPDSIRLYEDLRDAFPRGQAGQGALPGLPRIEPSDRDRVAKAAVAWLEWYETLFSEPSSNSSSWLPERMEYAFAVAAPGREEEDVLVAPEYPGGHLDWYAFDRGRDLSLGAQADAGLGALTQTVIPAPVTYRGMPAARWWELEDAQVDFGAVDAGPDDLLRMLMINFALEYGNDWFVLPFDQPVGTLCRVRSLVVTDSFGGRTLIDPYLAVDLPSRDWRMYSATGAADDRRETFFLPPALAASLHSEPVEEVLLLRDEMSNMAWAVERRIESQSGTTLDRYELFQERKGASGNQVVGDAAKDPDGFVYRISTRVPDYWTPLMPVSEEEGSPEIRLRRGRLLQGDNVLRMPRPLGRLLEPGIDLRMFEEEVPRAGARVTRAYQLARWIDGTTHAWIGRRKGAGRGEGSSGLRFDLVE